ncbi:MAG: SoxR reducing system RseC family protein [Halanaerobiaceae bacterium]
MEEIGQIIKNTGNGALVKIERHSLCSKCSNKCQLALEDSHETDEIEVEVSNPIGAKSGQVVKIEMGKQPIIIASLIIYLVPLLSLIIGYFAGQYIVSILGFPISEGAGILGSLSFLLLSFLFIKTMDSILGKNKNYQPIIKEIVE